MKNIGFAFFLLSLLFSCSEKEYQCHSIGAEDCKIEIKDNKGEMIGKECGATLGLNGESNEEVKKKAENLGFECKER